MIKYFCKCLKPSLKVKIKQRGREFDSFEEIIKKTVNAKTKAIFRPRCYLFKTNQYCLQGSRLASTKAGTQAQSMKDSKTKKPKSRSKNQKPPLLSVLVITMKSPSKLRRKQKRRKNERNVTKKESLKIPPQLLGPIIPAPGKKKAKETAPIIKT